MNESRVRKLYEVVLPPTEASAVFAQADDATEPHVGQLLEADK